MKELSIEEKAKAYDEALKRAKILYNDKNEIGYANAESVLEEVFPLLKESEDERIWKALIDYFRWNPNGQLLNEFSNREVFAWFEKQGEQKPIDYNDELKKCRENPLYFFDKYVKLEERKSTDKVEPKFKIGDEIKTANEEPLTITKIDEKGYWSEDLFICGFDEECCWDLVEQKPDWNNKEKLMLNDIIEATERSNIFKEDYQKELIDWLKSLKQRIGG